MITNTSTSDNDHSDNDLNRVSIDTSIENEDNDMNNATFNPTTATIRELRAYCNENNIEVTGDRRQRATFETAIETYWEVLDGRDEEPNEPTDEPEVQELDERYSIYDGNVYINNRWECTVEHALRYPDVYPVVTEYLNSTVQEEVEVVEETVNAPQPHEDAQEAPSNDQPTPWFISFIAYLVWLFIRLFRRRSSYHMA